MSEDSGGYHLVLSDPDDRARRDRTPVYFAFGNPFYRQPESVVLFYPATK